MKEVITWIYRALIFFIALTVSYYVISPSYLSPLSWLVGVVAFLVVAFLGYGLEYWHGT